MFYQFFTLFLLFLKAKFTTVEMRERLLLLLMYKHISNYIMPIPKSSPLWWAEKEIMPSDIC